MRRRAKKLGVTAAIVLLFVAVFLLGAGSAVATIDVAGWHFEDFSSHQIPIGFGTAFDSEKIAWVKYDARQSDVFLLDIATRNETQVTDTAETESNVALDGGRMAWVSRAGWDLNTPAELWLRDLDAGTTLCVAEGRIAEGPGLQIVGDHLAWSEYDPSSGGQGGFRLSLYVYTISKGTAVRVTDELASGGGGSGGQTVFDLADSHIAFVKAGPSGGVAEVWLYDLAEDTNVKLGSSAVISRHVSLEGDVVTWAAPGVTAPGASYEPTDVLVHRISSGATEKVATIQTPEPFPKTDGRFVVWDTYIGSEIYTENLRKIQGYDSQSERLIDVSHNLFLNFTPEISDGLVVWERGGELDSEIMAHDLVSGQTTQLSANHTWMDQLAQVRGRTVIWWKHWFSMNQGPEPPDGLVVATAPEAHTDPFRDVAGNHRYRTAILGVFEQQIAGGYQTRAEREFRPEEPLLRAQFAKMVCEALDVPVTEGMNSPFADLGPDDPLNLYPHEYVAALSALGILKGKTSSLFDPYAPLTRAQAVTIMVRSLDRFYPGLLRNVQGQAPGAYHWDLPHLANLKKAYANDLLSSLIDWVKPWDAQAPCSRGEAAQLVWNALSLIDQAGMSRAAGVRGLEAVPNGYALVVEGESREHVAPRHVNSLIIPELGVFQMELRRPTLPAEMVVTVRTPERQAGYRGQAVLEGEPRPMDMAFLESPLTYPSSGWRTVTIIRDGNHISAVLEWGTEPAIQEMTVEADIDPVTGIIIREEQQRQHAAGTITRRLVPLESVEVPNLGEVLAFARADWTNTFTQAKGLGYPVFGLDLPVLQPHMLQFGEGYLWLNYSTRAEPGHLAVEIWQVPQTEAESLPGRFPTSWSSCTADNGDSARMCTFVIGDRAVQVLVHDWVTDRGIASLEAIEEALLPLEDTAQAHTVEPPVLLFEGPMPLPSGANFGGLLPDAYRSNSG